MSRFIGIMGVSGCGKSTIGHALADKLALPFLEGDDFHPQTNIDKMSSGTPLTDEDRFPWLEKLGDTLKTCADTGAVFSCSALKETYRSHIQLALGRKQIHWVALTGSRDLLISRLQNRKGHFFDPTLLDSQLSIFELPEFTVDIDASIESIVTQLLATLR